MQSTPSRARHSSNICAPLINVDISSASQENRSKKQKGHQPGLIRPADGLWNLRFRLPQTGPGTMTRIIMDTGMVRRRRKRPIRAVAPETMVSEIRVYPTSLANARGLLYKLN